MNIQGWAFRENSAELQQENIKIYESLKLKNAQDFIVKESGRVSYAKHTYEGYIKEGFDISEKELAVYLDGGNLCFGGTSFISGRKFKVEVYTD